MLNSRGVNGIVEIHIGVDNHTGNDYDISVPPTPSANPNQGTLMHQLLSPLASTNNLLTPVNLDCGGGKPENPEESPWRQRENRALL